MADDTSLYVFSGRDFTARFEALLEKLGVDVPELTDRNHSDAGITTLRLVADTSDKLSDYIDEAFNGQFIELALFKQYLIDAAKTVDVLPKLSSAARTTLTITRIEGQNQEISIPQWTAFTRSDGLTYLTEAAAILTVGLNSINVSVVEGTQLTLTVNPEDFSIDLITDRAKKNLGVGIAAGTVTMGHGGPPAVPWIEADTFWRSLSTDQVFRLELWAEPIAGVMDTVDLVLGDGIEGKQLPPSVATITFIQCNGASGNCGTGTITGVPSSLLQDVTATNALSATGGAPAEDIESFRRRIPRVVRTQRRGVVTEDYSALIESIAGVKHCQAVDRNWGTKWPHMYMVLFVVPEGGGPMSTQLKGEILSECESWGHFGNWQGRYLLYDAVEVPVNISCNFGIVSGYNEASVAAAGIAAWQAMLNADNQEIGGTLLYSTIFTTIMTVPGIAWVEITTPLVNVSADTGEVLTAGTISLTG